MPKPSTLPLWSTNGGTTVEPLLAEKQAGWPNSFKPPARWFNWWMNLVYQWVQWLNDFESTAHTWTALQTFNGDILATGAGVNGDATIESTGSGNRSGLLGRSGSSTGAYGVKGIGVDGGTLGKHGVLGMGGAGTTTGGFGSVGIGGNGTGASGAAGAGVAGQGGAIDGTTNTSGAAGMGGDFKGGNISSDANNRKGGIGARFEGGTGQDGRGAAIQIINGDLEQLVGSIIQSSAAGNVLGDTQVDGDLTVNQTMTVTGASTQASGTFSGTLGVTGLLSANGGIALPVVTSMTPVLQAPWSAGSSPGYRKNAFGETRFSGSVAKGAATSGSVAAIMPVGFRPPQDVTLPLPTDSAGVWAQVSILTNGEVRISFGAGYSGAFWLDAVRYHTT